MALKIWIADMANSQWKSPLGLSPIGFTPVEPPPTPDAPFWFTVEIGGNDARGYSKATLYTRVKNTLIANGGSGSLGGRLKFYGGASGTIQDSLDNRTATGSTEPHPVICFKSYTTAQVNTRLGQLTAPESWVWFQEFYSSTLSGWNSGYNTDVAAMKALVDAHPNGHFVELQCVTSMADFRNNPGHFTDVDETVIDTWGADSYNAKTPPYTAQAIFKDQVDAFNIMKVNNPDLKWVVSEWGVPRQARLGTNSWSNYTGAERVSYAQPQVDYAIANGCSGITYWATDNSDVGIQAGDDHSIKDWSIDKGTAADNYFAAWLVDMMEAYPLP